MKKSGCSTLLKALFLVFDVRTGCIFTMLLNSLTTEWQ